MKNPTKYVNTTNNTQVVTMTDGCQFVLKKGGHVYTDEAKGYTVTNIENMRPPVAETTQTPVAEQKKSSVMIQKKSPAAEQKKSSVMIQKFALNATIPTKSKDFRASLNGVNRVYSKLADVYQEHLLVAFNNLNEHGNTTLLCVCLEQANITKGINYRKIKQYIADHVKNVRIQKKTNSSGAVAFTMFKDKTIENALIEVVIPSISWVDYTREPKDDSKVKTETQEIESLAKILANKKLTIEAMEKAIEQAKVIRINKELKKHVKTQAKIESQLERDNKKACSLGFSSHAELLEAQALLQAKQA